MKRAFLLSAVALSAAFNAVWAADAKPAAKPKTNLIDHSSDLLIDEASAKQVLEENIPAKVWALFPASKYAFLSQVEGGMKGTTCVVAARVILLPLTATVRAPLWRPQKTATAYDAVANSSTEACKALAKDKLKEATGAVVSAVIKS
jgi:hypothetical protein